MSSVTFTADRILPECIKILLPVFGERALSEARETLAEIAGVSALKVRLDPERVEISKADKDAVILACHRRAKREPIQYITGRAFFMYDEFVVGPGVLIPRGDTERLVEKSVEAWYKINSEAGSKVRPVRFIEFCTGSGCVSISFIKAVMSAGGLVSGVATDISDDALFFADENIRRLGMSELLVTVKHDLLSGDFSALKDKYGDFDLIIINPPYIQSDVIRDLEPEVREHEPLPALDGGVDGLDFYRAVTDASKELLCPGGFIVAEIGYDQEASVSGIFAEKSIFADIRTGKDHAGHFRIISARRKGGAADRVR